ncbi:DNRLRE domain-containing protein [Kitasatospora paranensis]|uniref:DNRLRE domain-containing protein n=1 Tax=Kitasatospora paranensis TaxID=258053 RepID=A0ABW2FU19_9ACTN
MGVLVPASPAAAASVVAQAPQVALAYTDAQAPTTAHPVTSGDLPLGAWLDDSGTTHTSRVYATFDLAGFAAAHVLSARLSFGESQADSCAQRAIEVWQTGTKAGPLTWRNAPAEKQLLGTVGGSETCPASYLQLDLTSAAAAAAAAKKTTLSVELRLPASDEGNVSLGRRLSGSRGVRLYATYNTPPGAPTQLFNDNQPCATAKPYPSMGELTPELSAMLHDADAGSGDSTLTGRFAVWPVGHRDRRTEFTESSMVSGWVRSTHVPAGVLADGGTYAWQVQGGDGTDTSAWSKPCYFHVDAVRPSAAPVVTAPNYPPDEWSAGGTPAEFTFTANGVSDVAAYQYAWGPGLGVVGTNIGPYGVPQWTDPFAGPGFVRTATPGGSASVTLIPPDSGPQTLSVRSFDRAFASSAVTTYRFYVRDTSPVVTPDTPSPRVGVPVTLHLAPNAAVQPVDSYTVQVGYGAAQTVAAAADGTASVAITLNSTTQVEVRSHSTNGWVSNPYRWFATVDTTPTVTSDIYAEETDTPASAGGVGVTGVFTFAPKVPDVASYTYSFDWNPETTVTPDATGTAQVSWAPDASGPHILYAYATDAHGKVYDTYYYYFDVN